MGSPKECMQVEDWSTVTARGQGVGRNQQKRLRRRKRTGECGVLESKKRWYIEEEGDLLCLIMLLGKIRWKLRMDHWIWQYGGHGDLRKSCFNTNGGVKTLTEMVSERNGRRGAGCSEYGHAFQELCYKEQQRTGIAAGQQAWEPQSYNCKGLNSANVHMSLEEDPGV